MNEVKSHCNNHSVVAVVLFFVYEDLIRPIRAY